MQQLHEHIWRHVSPLASGAEEPTFVGSPDGPFTCAVYGDDAPAIGFPSSEGNHPSWDWCFDPRKASKRRRLRRALTEPYATLNGPEFVFVRMRMVSVMTPGWRTWAGSPPPRPRPSPPCRTVSYWWHRHCDAVLRPAEIVDYRFDGRNAGPPRRESRCRCDRRPLGSPLRLRCAAAGGILHC